MKLVVSAPNEDLQPAIRVKTDSRRRNETTTETDRAGPTARETRRLPEERQPRGSRIAEEHLQETVGVARHIRLERIRKPTQTKPARPVNTARTGLPDVTNPVVGLHRKHFHSSVDV